MKQIDLISSENVVNIESPEKISITGEHSYVRNGGFLPTSSDKKNRFISTKNETVNRSGVFSRNFEVFDSCASSVHNKKFNRKSTLYLAMLREISTRINN